MPIYKLHEAPRADPSFSVEHAANLPPVQRVPLQPTPPAVPSSTAAVTTSNDGGKPKAQVTTATPAETAPKQSLSQDPTAIANHFAIMGNQQHQFQMMHNLFLQQQQHQLPGMQFHQCLRLPQGGGLPPSVLERQQIQMQIHQMKEHQFMSSMIGAPTGIPTSGLTGIPTSGLTGINYNKIPAPSPSPVTNQTAPETAADLRTVELTIAERRRRLAEAQKRAKEEAEALAKAEADLFAKSKGAATKRPAPAPGDDPTIAKKPLLGDIRLTSILEEIDNAFIDNAFKSTANPPEKSESDQLKITEEEILRAKGETATKALDHVVHQPQPNAGNASSDRSSIMVRINAMEQMRAREHEQRRIGGKSSAAVREALRNAGVGLISGDITPVAASTFHPTQSVAQKGMISKEMMDVFAKTAAAAISSKTGDAEDNTVIESNNRSLATAVPGAPSLPSLPKDTSSTEKKSMSAPTAPNPTSLPTSINSDVVSSSELDAARALMKIPGMVEQSSKEPMKGHWELVKPEELKRGTPLANTLPDVVSNSSGLSYDEYKIMAKKLSPPNVMRIPDGWNAIKEPVYLVVDPANAANPSIAPKNATPVSASLPTDK